METFELFYSNELKKAAGVKLVDPEGKKIPKSNLGDNCYYVAIDGKLKEGKRIEYPTVPTASTGCIHTFDYVNVYKADPSQRHKNKMQFLERAKEFQLQMALTNRWDFSELDELYNNQHFFRKELMGNDVWYIMDTLPALVEWWFASHNYFSKETWESRQRRMQSVKSPYFIDRCAAEFEKRRSEAFNARSKKQINHLRIVR